MFWDDIFWGDVDRHDFLKSLAIPSIGEPPQTAYAIERAVATDDWLGVIATERSDPIVVLTQAAARLH